jgi:sulfatase modifying factor 1
VIWVILAILGVPLWLIAAGIVVLVLRNRSLRHRPGAATAPPPRATTAAARMISLEGGTYLMGSDAHYPEERPVREVGVGPFLIDEHPVTNDEFHRFVAATGHVTVAEKAPNPSDYPSADPRLLHPGSAVFRRPAGPVSLRDPYLWWSYVPGASWRHPEGPGTALEGRGSHPVVHVAFGDAAAYAAWAGKELPTEVEWEYAARGGLEAAVFPWGDEQTPGGRVMANTWEGAFPWQNLLLDGYETTSPVGSFPPNGFGLYDVVGNVWEWTSDWYRERHGADPRSPCCAPPSGRQPDDPPHLARRTIKGGSHLCAPSYCFRFRPAARQSETVDTSTSHLGFRCIVRDP